VSHVNLIIRDKTGPLHTVSKADFCRVYFVPELLSAIAQVPFRVIYLISSIEGEELYARPKMLYLLSEAYLINSVTTSHEVYQQLQPEVDELELFASYPATNVEQPVLIHHNTVETGVIDGDCGIVVSEDNSITVRLHSDYPLYSGARPTKMEWEALLGSEFDEAMSTCRETHSFSTETFFPISRKIRQ
jgi:hypothetical protein